MKIRSKLLLGISTLFFLVGISSLVGIGSVHVLKSDTDNILTANYNSLLYSHEMLKSLENAENNSLFNFEQHLKSQENNITEKGEDKVTKDLRNAFTGFKNNAYDLNAKDKMRKNLYSIVSMNMNAIEEKSNKAKSTAKNATLWIGITASCCLLLSLTLLVNLPRSILSPIKRITKGIQGFAQNDYTHRIPYYLNNEYDEMIDAFNKMADTIEEFKSSTIAELLIEKKRNESLIKNFSDPIIGFDNEGTIVFVNDNFQQIAGIPNDNIIGQSVHDLAERNDLLKLFINDITNNDSNTNVTTKKEIVKIYADKKESFFEKDIVPIRISDIGNKIEQSAGYVCIFKNVTTYKELDSAKTHLIATVSHEFKTPIASIRMSLQLLENKKTGELNSEQKKLIDSISEDASRLLNITSELLTMSQVESGNIQLSIYPSDTQEIVRYAVHANKLLAEQKNVKIITELGTDVPTIMADSEKTAWVITNLISNALRYSRENSTMYVNVVNMDNEVSISVRDEGQGIAQEYIEKIFERYFRIPGSKREGTGLGLAISKEFIEAQNGRITAESEIGVGSIFTVYLKKTL